jgi:hypothetical protein
MEFVNAQEDLSAKTVPFSPWFQVTDPANLIHSQLPSPRPIRKIIPLPCTFYSAQSTFVSLDRAEKVEHPRGKTRGGAGAFARPPKPRVFRPQWTLDFLGLPLLLCISCAPSVHNPLAATSRSLFRNPPNRSNPHAPYALLPRVLARPLPANPRKSVADFCLIAPIMLPYFLYSQSHFQTGADEIITFHEPLASQ